MKKAPASSLQLKDLLSARKETLAFLDSAQNLSQGEQHLLSQLLASHARIRQTLGPLEGDEALGLDELALTLLVTDNPQQGSEIDWNSAISEETYAQLAALQEAFFINMVGRLRGDAEGQQKPWEPILRAKAAQVMAVLQEQAPSRFQIKDLNQLRKTVDFEAFVASIEKDKDATALLSAKKAFLGRLVSSWQEMNQRFEDLAGASFPSLRQLTLMLLVAELGSESLPSEALEKPLKTSLVQLMELLKKDAASEHEAFLSCFEELNDQQQQAIIREKARSLVEALSGRKKRRDRITRRVQRTPEKLPQKKAEAQAKPAAPQAQEVPHEALQQALQQIEAAGLQDIVMAKDLAYDPQKDLVVISKETVKVFLSHLYGRDEIEEGVGMNLERQEGEAISLSTFLHIAELLDGTHGRLYLDLDQSRYGKGSTAFVYFARNAAGKEVALKVYKPDEALTNVQRESQKREIDAAIKLREDDRFVHCLRSFSTGTEGIRFRDGSGKLCYLDDERANTITGGEIFAGSDRRFVMEMQRIKGKELGAASEWIKWLMAPERDADNADVVGGSGLCEESLHLYPEPLRTRVGELLSFSAQLPPIEQKDILKELREITMQAVLKRMAQAAEVVQAFHDQGFYHTDLKPFSFMVNGHVVMHDLGSAVVKSSQEEVCFSFSPNFVDMDIFGSGRLRPTEDNESGSGYAFRPCDYVPAYDVYQLVASLYFMMSGKEKGSLVFEPVEQHNPHISPLVAQFIAESLGQSPELRCKTAREFQFLLEALHDLGQDCDLNDLVHRFKDLPLAEEEVALRDALPLTESEMGKTPEEFFKAVTDYLYLMSMSPSASEEEQLLHLRHIYQQLLRVRPLPKNSPRKVTFFAPEGSQDTEQEAGFETLLDTLFVE